MLSYCLKFFFMFICSIYLYCKLLNLPLSKEKVMGLTLFSGLMQIPFYYIHTYTPLLLISIMIITLFILVIFVFKTPCDVAFTTSIISFGLSYFAFAICSAFGAISGALILTKYGNELLVYPIAFLVTGILQLILISLLFRIKRFRKGMPFLMQKNANALGIGLGLIILFANTIFALDIKNSLGLIIIFSILVLGVLLFRWWRLRLKQTYREKSLLSELDELNKTLEKTKAENAALSKIIHKDNKLIPAMEMAVKELLTACSDEVSTEDLAQKASQLLEELETISKERKGISSTYETSGKTIPQTELTRIDSLISYMYHKCILNNIHFDFTFNCNVKHMVNTAISQEKLATIIADLIENSIIATMEQPTKNILLTISIENGHYCLNIFDSGTHFAPEVISMLGKKRITTHANNGGSGIGMMTILEIASQHTAGFIIDETIESSLYTKKLSIIFDDSNKIFIKSRRPEITGLSDTRNDISFL